MTQRNQPEQQPEESGGVGKVIRVPDETHKRCKRAAKYLDKEIKEFVTEVMDEKIKDLRKKDSAMDVFMKKGSC